MIKLFKQKKKEMTCVRCSLPMQREVVRSADGEYMECEHCDYINKLEDGETLRILSTQEYRKAQQLCVGE